MVKACLVQRFMPQALNLYSHLLVSSLERTRVWAYLLVSLEYGLLSGRGSLGYTPTLTSTPWLAVGSQESPTLRFVTMVTHFFNGIPGFKTLVLSTLNKKAFFSDSLPITIAIVPHVPLIEGSFAHQSSVGWWQIARRMENIPVFLIFFLNSVKANWNSKRLEPKKSENFSTDELEGEKKL